MGRGSSKRHKLKKKENKSRDMMVKGRGVTNPYIYQLTNQGIIKRRKY